MSKKIYLIIIWTITLCVILFYGYKIGGRIYKGDSHHESKIERVIEQDLQEFDELYINGDIMSVSIKKGSKFSVYSVYNRTNLEPVISLENKKLEITQKSSVHSKSSNNCRLEITVPSNKVLKSMDIRVDVGEIDISKVNADKIELELDVGAIDVSAVNFNKIEASTDIGEVKINLTENTEEYDIDCKTSIGSITVNNQDFLHNYRQKNNKDKNIKAQTSIGSVIIR